jgi:hypothetical protein
MSEAANEAPEVIRYVCPPGAGWVVELDVARPGQRLLDFLAGVGARLEPGTFTSVLRLPAAQRDRLQAWEKANGLDFGIQEVQRELCLVRERPLADSGVPVSAGGSPGGGA